MITFENFFISTFAMFKVCKTPKRKPDYISRASEYWGGGISSSYWYGEDKKGKYVIRKSNHWVFRCTNDLNKNEKYIKGKFRKRFTLKIKDADCKMIATCNWQITLIKNKRYDNKKTTLTGKCYLSKFKKIR